MTRQDQSLALFGATDEAVGLVAFALSGKLWHLDVADGQVRRLDTDGEVVDPRPDPTGRRVAYLSRGSLRVIGRDGSGDRALAMPVESPNHGAFTLIAIGAFFCLAG
mgnify:CR=1 FL=1